MDSNIAALVSRIENNDYEVPYSDVDSPYLLQLPTRTWFEIIKKRPLWWAYRGPLSTEMYSEKIKEDVIAFLCREPEVATVYFYPPVKWSTVSKCDKVKESLNTDTRIVWLQMMLI